MLGDMLRLMRETETDSKNIPVSPENMKELLRYDKGKG